MRDSFVMYSDSYNAIKKLNNEQAGELLHAIFQYQIDGINPQMSPVVDMVFEFMKNHFDRDSEKWSAEIEKRREAGRLGGLARASNAKQIKQVLQNSSKYKQTQANQGDNVNVNVNVNDNVNVNENVIDTVVKKAFSPPTIEEVTSYTNERGTGIDPNRFFDFYQSKGWRVGAQPMKDWRAAVRTWERRDSGGFGNKNDSDVQLSRKGQDTLRIMHNVDLLLKKREEQKNA